MEMVEIQISSISTPFPSSRNIPVPISPIPRFILLENPKPISTKIVNIGPFLYTLCTSFAATRTISVCYRTEELRSGT